MCTAASSGPWKDIMSKTLSGLVVLGVGGIGGYAVNKYDGLHEKVHCMGKDSAVRLESAVTVMTGVMKEMKNDMREMKNDMKEMKEDMFSFIKQNKKM